MFNITPIPALQDNYIWMIHNDHHAAVVDPGEAAPVLEYLNEHALQLDAILCTHHHTDHTGGIAKLREVYNVPVYGRGHPGNLLISHKLNEGSHVRLDELDITFEIIEIPGHVNDHIAYLAPGMLFCGDTLFGAGCGRNFEGAPELLFQSLQRLGKLPDATRIYCGHEYTSANLKFALACEPNNPDLRQRDQATRHLRAAKIPTLPSTMAQEKATNPFLRCTSPELIHTLQSRGLTDVSEAGVFIALRAWRNQF